MAVHRAILIWCHECRTNASQQGTYGFYSWTECLPEWLRRKLWPWKYSSVRTAELACSRDAQLKFWFINSASYQASGRNTAGFCANWLSKDALTEGSACQIRISVKPVVSYHLLGCWLLVLTQYKLLCKVLYRSILLSTLHELLDYGSWNMTGYYSSQVFIFDMLAVFCWKFPLHWWLKLRLNLSTF